MAPVRTVALDLRANPPAPDDERAVVAAGALIGRVLDDLAASFTMSAVEPTHA
jgi:hypothetical protein